METIRNGKRRNGCSWDPTLSEAEEEVRLRRLAGSTRKERTHDTC